MYLKFGLSKMCLQFCKKTLFLFFFKFDNVYEKRTSIITKPTVLFLKWMKQLSYPTIYIPQ